jgi:phosphoglycolate phosphatase
MNTFIFDFDGTLAHSLLIQLEILNQIGRKYAVPEITQADIPLIREKSARDLFALYPLNPLQFLQLVTTVRAEMRKRIPEMEIVTGMLAVLKALEAKDCQLGMVTSNSRQNVKMFLDYNQIDCFTFIHSERNLWGKGKMLKKLIHQNKFDQEKVIYVGDEIRDIEAAREAGVKVAAVTWGFNSEEALRKANPDYIVNSPSEILLCLST